MTEIGVEEQREGIQACFDYFLDAMGSTAFESRTVPILAHLAEVHDPARIKGRQLTDDAARIAWDKDRFAWYMLLAKLYLDGSSDYNHPQGARVIPIFYKLGSCLSDLKAITGVEARVKKLAKAIRENPDDTLFELLVGLAYRRNGWSRVEFLEERSPAKTPDLCVRTDAGNIYVECKRMAARPEYAQKEKQYWLEMWKPLSTFLTVNKLPFLLEIDFHVELSTLGADFLTRELIPKLRLVGCSGVLIDNATWTVKLRILDLDDLRRRQQGMTVKQGSPMLVDLLVGEYRSERGFSWVVFAKEVYDSPSYIGDIGFVAGVTWYCDADASISFKAKHIKKDVAKAIKQIPEGELGIIHVGWEGHDGGVVEELRMEKIVENLKNLDLKGRAIVFIYCHAFDPRVRPHTPWDFGETVTWLAAIDPGIEVLSDPNLVIMSED